MVFFSAGKYSKTPATSYIINNDNNSRRAVMSFGFGIGDFAGILQLSWTLYRYCYKVARDAPEDFKLLLGEITMLSQSIRLLEEDALDPDSTIIRRNTTSSEMLSFRNASKFGQNSNGPPMLRSWTHSEIRFEYQ